MPNNTATSWIPGASDLLGYGVNIFGNYFKPDLKDQFLDFTPYDLPTPQWDDQPLPGITVPYKLPSSIAYSNISAAHGETIVAESKMEMSEKLSLRANAKGTYGGFTGTVTASYKNFNDTEEDRWYCLTDGSQTVYSLSAKYADTTLVHKHVLTKDIYVNLLKLLNLAQPCSPQNEETYFAFFDWYGTHVITGVEMGGGLHIFTSMEKTHRLTAQEVETSATAEYKGMFEGGGGADWKKNIQTWLTNRRGSIDAYGGDSGSPLLAKIMAGGVMSGASPPDLSADLTKWAESVPKNPRMVNLKLKQIGDLFESDKSRMLVNEAYQRYAASYLSISSLWGAVGQPQIVEWRRAPIQPWPSSVGATAAHGRQVGPVPVNPRYFQGWVVINRTTGAVESALPVAARTANQVVPAELNDRNKYNNDNYLLLFSHWEDTGSGSGWFETPFTNEVMTFLRHCGGGKVLQDYNSQSRRPTPYFLYFYVLCGVIGSGTGQGKEFTNFYLPKTYGRNGINEIKIPLVPKREASGFRLCLLD